MITFETGLVAACGFCQGFLAFPTIMIAPKVARAVGEIWAIPWKERRVANTFCLLVIFVFAWLIHSVVAKTFIGLADTHAQSLRPGKIWALFVFIGCLSYALVPGIEWRIRKRSKRSSSATDSSGKRNDDGKESSKLE